MLSRHPRCLWQKTPLALARGDGDLTLDRGALGTPHFERAFEQRAVERLGETQDQRRPCSVEGLEPPARSWFPLEAAVSPGPGGSITYGWGPGFSGVARILVWEPPHHLGTSWMDSTLPEALAETARQIAVDTHRFYRQR